MLLEHLQISGLPEVLESNPKVEERLEYAQKLQELVDPQNHLGEVSNAISDGAYPIFYSNHNHHLNIAGMRMVYQSLKIRPKDLHVAVSYTLLNFGQEAKLVKFARGIMSLLELDSVHLVPVARKKDIRLIKNDQGITEAKKALRATESNLNFIYSTLSHNAGFIFFPETTTTGAVKGESGKRPGMINVDNSMFGDFIKRAEGSNRELIFVPIGMSGTNRIIEPRISTPHKRALFEISKDKVGAYLGVDLGEIKPLAKVIVGEPFGVYDIWEEGVGSLQDQKFVFNNREELNMFMMKRVAELLSEEERGVYK